MGNIWHPFTQKNLAVQPIEITRAKGAYLITGDGRKIFDGISSWWVNIHGHAHEHIMERIRQQTEQLDHVLLAGFTHPPAEDVARKLLELTSPYMSKVFYSDNGSTAVEVAIKMSLQYWHNKNIKKRTRIIAFNHAYHGDTMGAMSVGHRGEMNRPFWPKLFPVEFIDPPTWGNEQQSLQQMRQLLQAYEDVAAFIFEPLVQGTAGMRMQNPQALNSLLQMAHKQQVLTIADEVMTGFGRTGKIFAVDYLEEKPDLLCVAKGLTGGVLPLGATLVSPKVYSAFSAGKEGEAFLHGHSFTGNPISCAAAQASLELLVTANCQQQLQFIQKQHHDFIQTLQEDSSLKRKCLDIRMLGTILALELRTQEGSSYFHSLREKIYEYFLGQDILLRPLGNVIYLIPPYCSEEKDLQNTYSRILAFLEELNL